jgi:hypothetical protein
MNECINLMSNCRRFQVKCVHILIIEALFYTIVLILALISIILAVILREAPTI